MLVFLLAVEASWKQPWFSD